MGFIYQLTAFIVTKNNKSNHKISLFTDRYIRHTVEKLSPPLVLIRVGLFWQEMLAERRNRTDVINILWNPALRPILSINNPKAVQPWKMTIFVHCLDLFGHRHPCTDYEYRGFYPISLVLLTLTTNLET